MRKETRRRGGGGRRARLGRQARADVQPGEARQRQRQNPASTKDVTGLTS